MYGLQWDVPWVRLALFVQGAGHLSDPVGKEGTAHLLEHALHQGTEAHQYRGQSELYDWLDEQPFTLPSASTSLDFMQFPLIVKAGELQQGLDFLFQFVCKPSMSHDIEIDREIVRRERVQNGPSPRRMRIHDALASAMGASNHRMNTATGLPDDEVLNAITHEDLLGFHERHFHPRQFTLLAVGSLDPSQYCDVIDRHFGDLRLQYISRAVEPIPFSRPLVRMDRFGPNGTGEATAVTLVYRWLYPFQAGKVDIVARNALRTLMYEEVREKRQLAYGVKVKVLTNAYAPSILLLQCTVKPQDEDEVRRVIESLVGNEGRIRSIFPRLVRTIERDLCFEEHTAFNLIDNVWGELRMFDRIRASRTHAEEFSRVTADETIAFITQYLNPADAYLQAIEDL
ncbi:MAG: insulinase family protein [Patescibacteria group bacterium]